MVGTFADHERGEEIHELVVATIRSVSNGVVGVAFLQALALGIGFLVLDVPAAGVLALAVLFLGVLQLPSALVVFPVLAWMWLGSEGSTLGNVIGTLYLGAAGYGRWIAQTLFAGSRRGDADAYRTDRRVGWHGRRGLDWTVRRRGDALCELQTADVLGRSQRDRASIA